jgi:O-antigen/teichoic acid export membrane protein
MSSSSTLFASERYARRDALGESVVVWTSLVITVAVTTCAAIAAGAWAPFLVSHLLGARAGRLGTDVLALRIVCGLFLVQSVAGTVNTPQVVRLRWRAYSLVTQGANALFISAVPIALALTSRSVVVAALVGLVALAFGALGSLFIAIRLQPALRHFRVEKNVARKLLRYGGVLTLAGLASIPLTTAERYLLAANRSTVVVAYYAVAASLGTLLVVIPEQLTGPLMPALARLEASGRPNEHLSLYRKSLQGLFLTLTPAAILMALVAHPFLAVWAGPNYGRYSTGPFFVILLGLCFTGLSYVPYSYLLSSGRSKTIARIRVAELAPYLAGAAFLTWRFGAMGAAVAWSARGTVDSVASFALVSRAGLHWWPLPTRWLAAVSLLAVLAGAVALAAALTHGLVPRLLAAVLLAVVYASAFWRFVLTSTERGGLRALLAETFPAFRAL